MKTENDKNDELKDEDLPHFCTVCRKRFAKIRQLYNHSAYYHEKSEKLEVRRQLPNHKCENCGKGHNSYHALRMHRYRCKKKEGPQLDETETDEDLEHSDLEEMPQNGQPKAKQYLQKAMAGYRQRIQIMLENKPLVKALKQSAAKYAEQQAKQKKKQDSLNRKRAAYEPKRKLKI